MKEIELNLGIKQATLYTLGLLLLQVVLSALIAFVLGFVLTLLNFGTTAPRVARLLTSLLSFILIFLYLTRKTKISLAQLASIQVAPYSYYVIACIAGIVVYFVVSFVMPLIMSVGPSNSVFRNNMAGRATYSSSYPGLLFFLVVAPIAEELFFRGIVLGKMLSRTQRWKGVLFSTALFSLYHLNPYLFFIAFVLGLATAYLFVKSKSVLPGILLHGTYNLCIIAL